MCYRCWFVGDPVLGVYTLRTKLEDDGLSISPEQRDALHKMCSEIEVKIKWNSFFWHRSLQFEDSKECVLKKKYKEFETCVLQHDVIDFKQVEGKLRQMILEYDSDKSDEVRFGIKSITWLKVFRTHGLSISPEQRDALLEICKEIEVKLTEKYFIWRTSLTFEDSKEGVLFKKYRESEMCVLEHDDWKQVEEKLRQFLLEYDSAESDELRFRIKSITWHKVFRTHEQSIPEPIRNCLYEMCKEIEGVLHMLKTIFSFASEAIIKRYQTLGHDVLEMEIVDWEDTRKSLRHILDECKRERGHQGITVQDLDGKQHIIYHRLRFRNDLDYLVNQVVEKTGISKEEFVLVYGESLIEQENEDLYIPDGAKLQLFPLEKEQKPPTNLTTFVRGIFNALYGKIDRLFKNFPKVFEDTTRLLSERDFVRISQLIGKGWGMLGIELGLSKVKLQQITEDKRNVASRIFEMLCQWGQTRKGGATAAQLLSAVRKSGVSCEFDKLQRALLIGL